MNPSDNFTRYAISENYQMVHATRTVVDKRNNSRLNYDEVDTKVLIYEDRMNGWFFDIAESLKHNNEAGFIILMVATSYLESNQQFRDGRSSDRDSTHTIERAIKRIFPTLSDLQVTAIQKDVRQGFFHDGISRKDIFINANQPDIFKFDGSQITINPHQFFDAIRQDFEQYMDCLKNMSKAVERQNFVQFWDHFKGI